MTQAHSSQGLFVIEFRNRVRDRIWAGSEQPFSTGSCESLLNKCGGSDSKESSHNAGDAGLIPGSERSPKGGNDNPLLYSCLENPMDRRAWRATVHGNAESDMTE